MIRLDRLVKDHRDSGALHTLVNLFGFIDDEAFLTKSGDVGVIPRVGGVDDECLTREQADHVAQRLSAALRVLDERCRLYQYLLKRDRPTIPHEDRTHPIVQAAVRDRLKHLATKADALWGVDLYIAVLYEGRRHRRRTAGERLRRIISTPAAALTDWPSRPFS
jgi:type IV secretion system protein VirB4